MKEITEIFVNEPQEDFSDPRVQSKIADGIARVDRRVFNSLKPIPILIGGREHYTSEHITVRDPADIHKIYGRVCKATSEHVRKACALADTAYRKSVRKFLDDPDGWLAGRKRVIERAVSMIRDERYIIAPLISCEVSKSLKGAFGEIEEAIDFANLYLSYVDDAFARAKTRADLVSERNIRMVVPHGSTAAISVWNFLFSLLLEKIFASYLMGCPVLVKPAEQSPVMAYYITQLLLRAGMESDYIAYLPGYGDVGEALVSDPAVAQICFTGSMEVGHIINETAAACVAKNPSAYPYGMKRVEGELGANNPMIVTRSANVDDVIKAVINSKWEQQGEKCSALQRLIIVAPPQHAFSKELLRRLSDAASSLEYGHPVRGKKKYNYNAVIDKDAFCRINERIQKCSEVQKPLLAVDLSHLAKDGYFIGPHIFQGIPHESPLVGDEMFGPVLFVFFADTLENAMELANVYPHITAGVFTQSNDEKKQFVRGMIRGLKTGLIYVNREIVGAVAGRHQFGPINQSGSGYKLGTKERLRFFVNEIGISENYLSQGVLSKNK